MQPFEQARLRRNHQNRRIEYSIPTLAGLAIWPQLDNANTLGNTEVNFVDQTMPEGEAIAAFRAGPLHGGTTKIVVLS